MKFSGSFGTWLKQRRKALDLTQRELAGQVACSVMTIRQIEGNTRRPSKLTADRLADALAISEDDRPAFLGFARRIPFDPPEMSPSGMESSGYYNFPPQPTSFVGRAADLAQISERLSSPACRLLSLVGPGGIGKTRLAMQAASENISSYVDGVCFVPLAPVTSPGLIAATIANALQLSLDRSEDPDEQIINYLREKAMLLVLDNFEHLLAGAVMVTNILAAAPRIKILITSRERLNLQEEWVLLTEGLSYPVDPSSRDIEKYSAVQLFAQRVQQVQATFSLVENFPSVIAICQRVEGMPLAIELAATWLRVMSCQQIAEQMANTLDFLVTPLRNVPDRHRNMRAVFDQSWRLLSEVEQVALMNLSVFRGGFDAQAAEQVADTPLRILAGLTDKSLVRVTGSGRYDIHELVRQYAADKLAEAVVVVEMQHRHFDYFLGMAEQGEHHFYGAETSVWIDRLDVDHDNFRAALDWALRNQESERGLQLAVCLARFWRNRYYRNEGQMWLGKFLASTSLPSSTRSKALYSLGQLFSDLGDNASAITLISQGLAVAERVGDESCVAWSRALLGYVVKFAHGGRQALPHLEEALRLFRELGDQRGIHTTLEYLGRAMLDLHDYERAMEFLEEGAMINRRAQIKLGMAHHLCLLGSVSCYQNQDPGQTMTLFEEALSIGREARDRFIVADSLLGLASVARAQEDYAYAQMLYEESLTIMDRETGHKYCTVESLWGLGAVARSTGEYDQSIKFYEESLILNQGGDRWDSAYCLAGLGGLAIRQEPVKAARLLAASAPLFENHRDLYPADRDIFAVDVATVRAQLGEVAFGVAWAEGQAMTLDQSIAYALSNSVFAKQN